MDGFNDQDHKIKVFPVQTGMGIMGGKRIVIKKLTSLGKVDETFKACETQSALSDVIYDMLNPSLILALTETSNEI